MKSCRETGLELARGSELDAALDTAVGALADRLASLRARLGSLPAPEDGGTEEYHRTRLALAFAVALRSRVRREAA